MTQNKNHTYFDLKIEIICGMQYRVLYKVGRYPYPAFYENDHYARILIGSEYIK
mgnify:CR=1 FL=1